MNCPKKACRGPMIWANSRLSVACFQRGHRVRLDADVAG